MLVSSTECIACPKGDQTKVNSNTHRYSKMGNCRSCQQIDDDPGRRSGGSVQDCGTLWKTWTYQKLSAVKSVGVRREGTTGLLSGDAKGGEREWEREGNNTYWILVLKGRYLVGSVPTLIRGMLLKLDKRSRRRIEEKDVVWRKELKVPGGGGEEYL